MDPNATIDLINDAIAEMDLCSAYDHATDLERWIVRGGFTPECSLHINRDMIRIIKRGILQCSNEGRCACHTHKGEKTC